MHGPSPERDQEKWSSGFPAKSRDQQRIWSGHGTAVLSPEMIPLQSAIRKSGLPIFLENRATSKESGAATELWCFHRE